MGKVIRVSDSAMTCYAVLELMNGDPIYISLAQTGILVKKSKLGIMGPVLYKEDVIYRAAMTGKALCFLYPNSKLPSGFTNPNLRAYANGVLHCTTAAEVAVLLNEAISRAERNSGTPIDALRVSLV